MNNKENKKMMTFYFKLYVECLNIKIEREIKELNCQQYFTEFVKFKDKYYKDKESIN